MRCASRLAGGRQDIPQSPNAPRRRRWSPEAGRLRAAAAGGAIGLAAATAAQAVPAYVTAPVRINNNAANTQNKNVESDYVPNVVQAENGAASMEALKAQAVIARTFLYYKLNLQGWIGDGQNDQVYTGNGAAPLSQHVAASAATEREILRFNNVTIASFYVAGARPNASTGTAPFGVAEVPPDTDATGTEHYVTYNRGLTGSGVTQTTLGWVNPGNNYNRGALSQNGSDFLSDNNWNYVDILRFYYGADIRLEMATTPSGGPLASAKKLATFEVKPASTSVYDSGYFSTGAISGTNRNLTSAASAASTAAGGYNGSAYAQKITINYNESNPQTDTTGFVYRHLSGLGPNTPASAGAAVGSLTTNLALESIGSIGFWLKATSASGSPGLTAALMLDDGAALERSSYQSIVADGVWRQYVWDLDDAADWENFSGGNGAIDAALFSIDSIRFAGLADATIWIDDLTYNPSGGSLSLVPEPTSLATLLAGGIGLTRRPRRRA